MSTPVRLTKAWAILAFVAMVLSSEIALVVEEPEYTDLSSHGIFEIRR